MSSARSSLWTKTVAIGIVVMASVIGNVSLSASEVSAPSAAPIHSPSIRPASSEVVVGPSTPLSGDRLAGMGYSNFDFSVTSVDRIASDRVQSEVADSSADSGQVVPAIYAWDPDVRFVFYRHVSKWM